MEGCVILAMLGLFVAVLIVAAAPKESIDDLIRRGNAAFEAKDYLGAVRLYEQAEVHATDPGLVAFNKAAALYRLGLAEDEVAASALRFVLSHPAVTCVIPGMRLVHNWSATPP